MYIEFNKLYTSQIQQVIQFCTEKGQDISLTLPNQVIRQLYDYFDFCFEALSKCNQTEVQKFRDLAGKEIGDTIDAFYDLIDGYRRDIFKTL